MAYGPSAASTSAQEAPRPRTGTFAERVTMVRLGEIKQEYPLVQELERVLELPYFPQPPLECLAIPRVPVSRCERTGP